MFFVSRIDKFAVLIFIAVLVGVVWIIATKIIIPSALDCDSVPQSGNKIQQELKEKYDHDQIDLVTREEVKDDGYPGPIVYIVKDKGTNKEYMIFMSSHGENMNVFPR